MESVGFSNSNLEVESNSSPAARPRRGTNPARTAALALLLLCMAAMMALISKPTFASALTGTPPAADTGKGSSSSPECDPNWTAVTSANQGSGRNHLSAVSALSSDNIWAAGYYDSAGVFKTFIQHWNGNTWSMVPSPNVGLGDNFLHGITAITATDIWAVGSYFNPGASGRTLIMHWDGSTWNVVTSPNVGTDTNTLSGISAGALAASDPTELVAAGYYHVGNVARTLVVRWDGSTWNVVTSPNVGTAGNYLQAVTTLSASDMWAVGFYVTLGGESQTLIEHWNGSTWSVVYSPNPGSNGNYLAGVAAVTPNSVWAVGNYGNINGINQTLILRWDGSTWTLQDSPNVGLIDHTLTAIAASSTNNAWAVGEVTNGIVHHTFITQWNGSSWVIVASANPSGLRDRLNGVAIAATDKVWAVGEQDDGTLRKTLVEEYNPCSCTTQYTDVPTGSTFHPYITCMACQGTINGYTTGCETGNPCFRPNLNVTRGQLAKIVANASGLSEAVGAQQYEDVPPGSTFYNFVWRLANKGYISRYACGGPAEPCGPGNLPYFRPNGNASRGQISKIVSNAAGFNAPAGAQIFQDVAPGSTFYDFVQRLANRGVMSGYACGGPGEPCGPGNLPYFRPQSDATRGQTSKIVANTFSPGCDAH